MDSKDETNEQRRRAILDWFAERDSRGSQVNFPERSLEFAAQEAASELNMDQSVALAEISDLRKAGLIETIVGTGGDRGAYVTKIAQRGRDALSGHLERSSTISHRITATNIGVVGTMTGGSINQAVGATWQELAEALEALGDKAEALQAPSASVVEAVVHTVLAEIRAKEPNKGKVRKILNGISEVIQTLGELGPAWALVATEAAKVGIQLALPS